jgi:hypothetical protein
MSKIMRDTLRYIHVEILLGATGRSYGWLAGAFRRAAGGLAALARELVEPPEQVLDILVHFMLALLGMMQSCVGRLKFDHLLEVFLVVRFAELAEPSEVTIFA